MRGLSARAPHRLVVSCCRAQVYVWKGDRGPPHRNFFRAHDSWDSGGWALPMLTTS